MKAVTEGNQLCKFADDTYLVIPASNIDSRSAEVDNIETWARTNNLTLNRKKSNEIVFVDRKRKRQVVSPPLLPGIVRATSLKILGITMTNGLTASDHVRLYVASSVHARRLSMHCESCMCDSALQDIYRSIVVAKLLYASSAWSGFITATDRQRVDAFLDRSKRCGYCPPDLPPFEELLSKSDQQLFDKILTNDQHLLYKLLPPPSFASQNYNIRNRAHNKELPHHTGHLTDSNFITRMLFTDIY